MKQPSKQISDRTLRGDNNASVILSVLRPLGVPLGEVSDIERNEGATFASGPDQLCFVRLSESSRLRR